MGRGSGPASACASEMVALLEVPVVGTLAPAGGWLLGPESSRDSKVQQTSAENKWFTDGVWHGKM
jgi:hypothetical protein